MERVNAVVKAGLGALGLADQASKLKRKAILMWRNQRIGVSRGGAADHFLPRGYRFRRRHWYLDTRNRDDEDFQKEVYDVAAAIARRNGYRRVYDVGCGSGKKTLKYFGHLEVIGFEIEPTLSHLRRRYSDSAWELSDFSRTDYEPCDLLLCADVIEHVAEPDRLLRMIERMQPRDIVISTPERGAITEQGCGPPAGPPDNPFHLREWSLDEFGRLLRCHFDIVEQRRLSSVRTQQLAHCRPRRH
jgi:SAM-dependent methyltransferase